MLEYAALVVSPRALPDGLILVFQHPARGRFLKNLAAGCMESSTERTFYLIFDPLTPRLAGGNALAERTNTIQESESFHRQVSNQAGWVVSPYFRSSSFRIARPIFSRMYGFLTNAPAPISWVFRTRSLSEKPLTIIAFWPGLISSILR